MSSLSTFPLALLGVGGGELMLILLVVLLLFGGDRMPQAAKSIVGALRELKKMANDVEREIKQAIDEVPDVPDVGATLREALEDKPYRGISAPPDGWTPNPADPAVPPRVAAPTLSPGPDGRGAAQLPPSQPRV